MIRTFAVYFKDPSSGKKFLNEIMVTDANNAKDVLERWIRKAEIRKEKIELLAEPIYSAPVPELSLQTEVATRILYPGGPEIEIILEIEYVQSST